MLFYENIMKYVAANLRDLVIFSVAIDKKPAAERNREPRETAWQWGLQRVHRFCDDGDHCALNVNRITGGPPGIKYYPWEEPDPKF